MCLEGLLRSLIPFRNSVTKSSRGWHDFPASDGDNSVLNTARTEAAGMGNALLSLLPCLAQCMLFFHPAYLSCFVLFEYEQFRTKQQEKGVKT